MQNLQPSIATTFRPKIFRWDLQHLAQNSRLHQLTRRYLLLLFSLDRAYFTTLRSLACAISLTIAAAQTTCCVCPFRPSARKLLTTLSFPYHHTAQFSPPLRNRASQYLPNPFHCFRR